MGILSKARHNLGFHTGEWIYDAEGQCAQTRTCTGCDDVSTRVKHSFGDWYRRLPCDEATCGMIRTCRVCPEFTFKSEHEFTWHYFTELQQLPDFAGRPKLTKAWVTSPCKQFSLCDHCYTVGPEYRVWHDWGPSTVGGIEHVQLNDVEGFDVPKYYQACKVCDKRTPAGPP